MNANHVLRKVSLDAEAMVALAEALEVIGIGSRPIDCRWLAHLAVNAVCREIVTRGKTPDFPLAVSLRIETPEEKWARTLCLDSNKEVQP